MGWQLGLLSQLWKFKAETEFEQNRPVADFFCVNCNEEYELKSQKKKFGRQK